MGLQKLRDRIIEDEFPIKKSTAYFNNASYTPMSLSAIRAVNDALTNYSRNGPDDAFYLGFKEGANKAKKKLAKILGVGDSQDIVFTESATQGINMVAKGFKISKGDSIVTRGGASEHPSNYLPWKYYMKGNGVNIIDLDTDELGFPDLAVLDSELKRNHPRLVVLSHVLYNIGTIMPAKEISKIAHENGALLFLDVSQSVGNVPTNLEEIGCDYAAGTAAKWLCGPLGLGFFYCRKESLEFVEPLNFGANSCMRKENGSYMTAENAIRLSEGFRNWSYAYGLEKAIELLEDLGLERSMENNLKLSDLLIESLLENQGRYRFIGTRDREIRTSIIPIECLDSKPSEVVAKLANRRVTIAEREIGAKKILRVSPHFYNDEQETFRLTSALSA